MTDTLAYFSSLRANQLRQKYIYVFDHYLVLVLLINYTHNLWDTLANVFLKIHNLSCITIGSKTLEWIKASHVADNQEKFDWLLRYLHR